MVNYLELANQFLISILVGFILIPIVFYFMYSRKRKTIKQKKKGKKNLINIVMRGKEGDYLFEVKDNRLDFNFKLWNDDYNISKGKLFIKKKNLFRKIYDRIRKGISREYLIVFRKGESKAIELIVSDNNPVTINKLSRSGIVQQALREQFQRMAMNRRRLILLVVIVSVMALAITKFMGMW